ncbi:hypothetical protein SCOR_29385 [Sulfidibacter corallicola]|uniref:Uncharacterized protein n=1 Tax=Sulfidibacter corallicola TaxID=2818388 RepID=A0A8A4TLB4_SULCO|nr:hypothetical protein [Sulfidibacter corallicola]QTD50330.1 hypothetical protein J3U87_32500 [Sulfidibacter corallicola]
MLTYTPRQIQNLAFRDSHLKQISWRNEQKDILFHILWKPRSSGQLPCPTEPSHYELVFKQADQMVFQLDFRESRGYPILDRMEIREQLNGWQVELRFQQIPQGRILLDCENVIMKPVPQGSSS